MAALDASAGNKWRAAVAANPDHAANYIARWKRIEAEGNDIHGEARLVDALVARESRILDAGCGTGRVGGYLSAVGHRVVGVDLDPDLIAAAESDFPHARWHVGNLARLDLRDAHGERETFDLIICAGNVMGFLADDERGPALRALAEHVTDGGRFLVGFSSGRGWSFEEFLADARAAGFVSQQCFSSWDLRPTNDEFLVALLGLAL